MRGFDHTTILSPSFHGLCKKRLAPWPPICILNTKKPSRGILPEKMGRGVRHSSWNPYPISDQNLWFSLPFFRPDQKFDTLPYFRPEALEPRAWPERVTSCYGMYTVGANIKREMVLSPNDEEVASTEKHTQFKTRVHKPYPFSDHNGRKTKTAKKPYPLALHIPI